ncbi:MAG: M23 family metallopeptidase [Caldilineaceae bacterium]
MPRPLFDTPYIFGFHDPGGESLLLTAGRPGWIVFPESIGSDPSNISGFDYTPWSSQDLGVMVRLNYGYEPDGTIPVSSQYENFAKRCANFVANSAGCKIWIIGNEPNLHTERPVFDGGRAAPRQPKPPISKRQLRGAEDRRQQLQPQSTRNRSALDSLRAFVDGREVITPSLYARCYQLCRAAIRAVPGHANDQVLIAGIAPWNNQTSYPGNELGDWVVYFQDILNTLGPGNVDGVALHVYSHGPDPNLITASVPMDYPFQQRQYNFLVYRDWMNAIPITMRSLPVYISETDQIDPWVNVNSGWVQSAYAEINWWNTQPGRQQIRALCLYRWPNYDPWGIDGKSALLEDVRAALQTPYRWFEASSPGTGSFQVGDTVRTRVITNMRRTPGYLNKSPSDIVVQLAANTRLAVLNSTPVSRDTLLWWNLRSTLGNRVVEGWVAQSTSQSTSLLEKVASAPNPSQPTGITIGGTVRTLTIVRMRRTPGYLNKSADDVLRDVPSGTSGTVYNGPVLADKLIWWLVRTADGATTGWMAEVLADGSRLLEATAPPAGLPTLARGDLAQTTDVLRVRQSPGYVNKPANDSLGAFYIKSSLYINDGPQSADGLNWWRVGGIMSNGVDVIGWVAQTTATGSPLLQFAAKLPATSIPDKLNRAYLGTPYQGQFAIAQMWGENTALYSQISYDGVALLGHNGVDFLTPTGTQLLAVDNGIAIEVVPNDPTGYGNYVKLQHSWGETIYGHMLDFAVTQGQAVQRGQTIGRSGQSGNVTGPHLHLAIRINPYDRRNGWGGYSDPLPYLNPADYQLPFYVLTAQQRSAAKITSTKRVFPGLGYALDKPNLRRP